MGLLSHRDYDVKISGRELRVRVREEGEGVFSIEVGGRRLEVRIAGSPSEGDFTIIFEGREYPVRVREGRESLEVLIGGKRFPVEIKPVRPTAG